MNHRALQRTLFRMQLDAGFAARLRARDADAQASTGLDEAELAWLRSADPVAVSADREGRRRAQLLRNVGGEFPLCCAAARASDWLEDFTASSHFHTAIARDASLALAFADYARERAASTQDARCASLVALETALARARRARRVVPPAASGALRLAPRAWLVDLEAGTFAWASALREALDRGGPPPPPPASSGGRETVLVWAREPETAGRLAHAQAERLEPGVAALLRACEPGLGPAARRAFCREHALEPEALDGLIDDLAADGVLLRA